jgi:hypothetical protein
MPTALVDSPDEPQADESEEPVDPASLGGPAQVREAFAMAPALVVQGRVVVNLDLDDDDIPVFNTEPVFANKDTDAGAGAQLESDLAFSTVEAVVNPVVEPAHSVCGEAVMTARNSKVLVDIEDFELGDVCNGCRSRPSSADPPMVEIRRRAATCAVTSSLESSKERVACSKDRCAFGKKGSGPCSKAGQFSACALCPRSHDQHEQVGAAEEFTPCAACNCGIRVIAKNTFITIDTENDQEVKRVANRRRSKSE